jgi:hypothetical protein
MLEESVMPAHRIVVFRARRELEEAIEVSGQLSGA